MGNNMSKKNFEKAIKAANEAKEQAIQLIVHFENQCKQKPFCNAPDIHDECMKLRKKVESEFLHVVGLSKYSSNEMNRCYIQELTQKVDHLQQVLLREYQKGLEDEKRTQELKAAYDANEEALQLIVQFKNECKVRPCQNAADIHDQCMHLRKTVISKFSHVVELSRYSSKEVNSRYIDELSGKVQFVQQDLLKELQRKEDLAKKKLEKDKATSELNAVYHQLKREEHEKVLAVRMEERDKTHAIQLEANGRLFKQQMMLERAIQNQPATTGVSASTGVFGKAALFASGLATSVFGAVTFNPVAVGAGAGLIASSNAIEY